MPGSAVESREEWVEEVTKNLDYYLTTEEGKRKLLEEAQRMADQALQEVARLHRPQREIVWLSRYCYDCLHFRTQRGRLQCIRWGAKLVKPFYGKPLWFMSRDQHGNRVMDISEVDWDRKWLAVSDLLVEQAVNKINDGRPYDCFERAR
ncbi:MAG: hypothetical protein JRN39_04750 [Nitrososphaerota archaeon]|nr:hypothetical protein [Nitrososphaerota archaeon]